MKRLSQTVNWYEAKNEEMAMKLHKVLRITWDLNSDTLTSNPPVYGFVICDARFDIRLISNHEFGSLEFHDGDLVVFCRNPQTPNEAVCVCRAQAQINNNGSMTVRGFRCGTFNMNNLGDVPQGWAEVVKQAVVLARMLCASQPPKTIDPTMDKMLSMMATKMSQQIDKEIMQQINNTNIRSAP